jgi:alpha-galactosidase
MRIFGREVAEGPGLYDDGRTRVDYAVARVRGGWRISGTVRGRPGRIEIYRAPAPAEFLLNNWQSWGPMRKVKAGDKLDGAAERMAKQGRYVFSPIPDVFLRDLVSDYVAAWDGGLAGFLASRVGHPYFAVEGGDLAGYIEYFDTPFEDPVPLEPLVVVEGGPVELLLEEYAIRVAAENGVCVRTWNPVGWSSWYHYFTELRWADVEKNLRIARERFPFEVFQIDDGYEADIGDWLRVKDGFGPLPDLARLISGRGFHPGLWTAPFAAAETSRLFEEHPDWMVSAVGLPKFCFRGWSKDVYALDTTNPRAKAWLHETFSSLRAMGFDYHKIDFVFAAAMEGARGRRLTPIQAYREGLAVVREAIGDAFLLGCGAPLLPSIGFVDGMRVGEDTAPFWDSSKVGLDGVNAYHALKNSILRSFMHRKWWLNDPDCLLLRARAIDLSDGERALYARAAGSLDNMIIESDDLELVDDAGRALLAEAIGLKGGHVRVRQLLSDDFYLIDSWGGPAGIFRYAANLSDAVRTTGGRDVAPRSGAFITPEK